MTKLCILYYKVLKTAASSESHTENGIRHTSPTFYMKFTPRTHLHYQPNFTSLVGQRTFSSTAEPFAWFSRFSIVTISAPKIYNLLPPPILQYQTVYSFRRHSKAHHYFQSVSLPILSVYPQCNAPWFSSENLPFGAIYVSQLYLLLTYLLCLPITGVNC